MGFKNGIKTAGYKGERTVFMSIFLIVVFNDITKSLKKDIPTEPGVLFLPISNDDYAIY